MKVKSLYLTLVLLGCTGIQSTQQALANLPEFQDVSVKGAQIDCASNSTLVGKVFDLTTRAHGVSGTIRIIDDCTLLISHFNFDGKGRLVELYAAKNSEFSKWGFAISRDLLRTTASYISAELLVRLPTGISLEDFDSLSIWCTEVGVSFGDVKLAVPM